MKYPLIRVSVLGVLLLGVAACQNGNQAAAPEPENVVARVNGEAIGAATVDSQMQALSARGQQTTRAQALQEVITVKLLAQLAEEKGLHEKPDVAVELDRQRASLLAQQLVRSELEEHEVGEEDLQARYDEQFGSEGGGQEYHARHILTEEKEQAEAVIAQLDGGADFAELAKKESVGPSGKNGGDLGWFQTSDMVEPFGKAVESLETGSYSETPVQTQFGWHVVLLEETREARPPAFEEVRSQLQSQMVSEYLQQFVSDARDSAEVEIVDEELAPDAGQAGADAGAVEEEVVNESATSSE